MCVADLEGHFKIGVVLMVIYTVVDSDSDSAAKEIRYQLDLVILLTGSIDKNL